MIRKLEPGDPLLRPARGPSFENGEHTSGDPCNLAPQAIVHFWFETLRPRQWFCQNDALDQCIRQRFGDLCAQAQNGRLRDWEDKADTALALVLLLDQFSRHAWRGDARAFNGDAKAISLSDKAVQRGWLDVEPQRVKRQFWLMPYLHSESLCNQIKGVALIERYADEATARVARRHRSVIQRFGRFPHRNAVLHRANTPAEVLFLSHPQT